MKVSNLNPNIFYHITMTKRASTTTKQLCVLLTLRRKLNSFLNLIYIIAELRSSLFNVPEKHFTMLRFRIIINCWHHADDLSSVLIVRLFMKNRCLWRNLKFEAFKFCKLDFEFRWIPMKLILTHQKPQRAD